MWPFVWISHVKVSMANGFLRPAFPSHLPFSKLFLFKLLFWWSSRQIFHFTNKHSVWMLLSQRSYCFSVIACRNIVSFHLSLFLIKVIYSTVLKLYIKSKRSKEKAERYWRLISLDSVVAVLGLRMWRQNWNMAKHTMFRFLKLYLLGILI